MDRDHSSLCTGRSAPAHGARLGARGHFARVRGVRSREGRGAERALGAVRNAERGRPDDPARPDGLLDPDAVAHSYMAVLKQPRSAWSLEVEVRPWLEPF